MSQDKIMIVDNEMEIIQLIKLYLSREGYDVVWTTDSTKAAALAENENPDLILLDVVMPGMNGIELCSRIREQSDVPILFVSCKGQDMDKVLGLSIGGDDYITKPFGVMELISRVKAVLRRVNITPSEILEYENIRIDEGRHDVTVDSNHIELTYKEYEILKILIRNKGIVLTRDRLMETIWGYDFEQGNRTVDVHIQSLRKKLGGAGECIKTIRNVGYKIGD